MRASRRARTRGYTRPNRRGRQKTDRAAHLLVGNPVSFLDQFGFAISRARRKAGDVTVENGHGFGVPRRAGTIETQRHPERRVVLDQQPMVRRDRHDPAPVNQTPGDHLGKSPQPRGVVQGADQILAREFFVQVSQ